MKHLPLHMRPNALRVRYFPCPLFMFLPSSSVYVGRQPSSPRKERLDVLRPAWERHMRRMMARAPEGCWPAAPGALVLAGPVGGRVVLEAAPDAQPAAEPAALMPAWQPAGTDVKEEPAWIYRMHAWVVALLHVRAYSGAASSPYQHGMHLKELHPPLSRRFRPFVLPSSTASSNRMPTAETAEDAPHGTSYDSRATASFCPPVPTPHAAPAAETCRGAPAAARSSAPWGCFSTSSVLSALPPSSRTALGADSARADFGGLSCCSGCS